jgi:hypothetical protein
MKNIVAALVLTLAVAPAVAQKSCEELKSEIAAKLDAKGVKSYQLEIVTPEEVKDRKVVGSCELGKKRIVYTRDVKQAGDAGRPTIPGAPFAASAGAAQPGRQASASVSGKRLYRLASSARMAFISRVSESTASLSAVMWACSVDGFMAST